jgi:UPF0716 protein FxsA
VRWLALAFLVVPLVELWLLLRVGDVIGFWPTVGLVVAMAVLGAWLAKREGLRVLQSWQRALAEFRVPEEGVTSGVLVLVGAVLLMTPGVLTDLVGIAFLVPASRRLIAPVLEKHLSAYWAARAQRGGGGTRFTVHTTGFDMRGGFVTTERPIRTRVDPGSAGIRAEPPGGRRTVEADGQLLEDREIKETR